VWGNLLGRLRRVKRKARHFGLLLGLFPILVGACAGPRLRPESPAGAGPLTRDAGGLSVSVEAEAWAGRPRRLPEVVLPFLVRVRNAGPEAVTITRQDFLLLDDTSRQYLPLAPGEVVLLLANRQPGPRLVPSVAVSGSSADRPDFEIGLGIDMGGTDARDVILTALPEGPILPRAEVRGFLYFPPPPHSARSLRLLVVPRGLPGPPRLEFPFLRTNS